MNRLITIFIVFLLHCHLCMGQLKIQKKIIKQIPHFLEYVNKHDTVILEITENLKEYMEFKFKGKTIIYDSFNNVGDWVYSDYEKHGLQDKDFYAYWLSFKILENGNYEVRFGFGEGFRNYFSGTTICAFLYYFDKKGRKIKPFPDSGDCE